MKVLLMNGPNLDRLGRRDPKIYGTQTLADVESAVAARLSALGAESEAFWSSCEGALVDKLHATDADAVILNAGAYTHYSYALRDAIECCDKPVVEVHMSNVHAREEFRHASVLSAVCIGVIAGFGLDSYVLAAEAAVKAVKRRG